MEILVDGARAELDGSWETVGAAVSALDGRLETAGRVIVYLSVDGAEVPPDGVPAMSETPRDAVGLVEIRTESFLATKANALSTLLELLSAAESTRESGDPEALASLLPVAVNFRDALGGVFSAEELSFLDYFVEALEAYQRAPAERTSAELSDLLSKLGLIFSERRDEIADPANALAQAGRLYGERRADILEVPVRLQTGRDAEAMRTMGFLIELINKTVRIMPALHASGEDLSRLEIDGGDLNEFYSGFNGALRELMDAFERKDVILIGDLAEYELVPKLDSFFAAVGGPSAGGGSA